MSTHTPGPWGIVAQSRDLLITARAGLVAKLPHSQHPLAPSDEVSLANARLIAAAPDLLEAGKMLLESLEWEEKRSGTTYRGMDTLRAAIATADGRRGVPPGEE
jgi:hypothetical protein